MHTFLMCLFCGENHENPNQLLINYSWTFLSPLLDANLALATDYSCLYEKKSKSAKFLDWVGRGHSCVCIIRRHLIIYVFLVFCIVEIIASILALALKVAILHVTQQLPPTRKKRRQLKSILVLQLCSHLIMQTNPANHLQYANCVC